MSDYPIWWDTTITIYNKYEDSLTHFVRWYKHTVDNCFWKETGDKVTVGSVTLDTESIICRIPKQGDFLEKHIWVTYAAEDMADYFTLAPGDIIIKGKVTDDINEYESGHRSTDILKKYKNLQGCMEVKAVAINTGIGRNNPHYYVRGE